MNLHLPVAGSFSKKLRSWAPSVLLGMLTLGTATDAFADNKICFLQPLNRACYDPSQDPSPLGLLGAYFNDFYPYIVGIAAGFALLMVIVGGVQVIYSGGNGPSRQQGLDRLRWAIIGLLMIVFSTIILQTLNPNFYR